MSNFFNIDNGNLIYKKTSNKKFGLFFGLVFSFFGIYTYFFYHYTWWIFFLIAFLFLSCSFFYPKILKYPNDLWHYLGFILGAIISRIILTSIYVAIFIPVGIFIKFVCNDMMNLKTKENLSSYWLKRDKSPNSMKKQY